MSERIFRRTPDGNTACQNLELIENRAMRMVLMQVDGIQTEAAIFKKLGQTEEVKRALIELELQGFIYLAPASTLTMETPEAPAESAESESAEATDEDAAIAAALAAAASKPPSSKPSSIGGGRQIQRIACQTNGRGRHAVTNGRRFCRPLCAEKKEKEEKEKRGFAPATPACAGRHPHAGGN